LSDRELGSAAAPREPPQLPGVAVKLVSIVPWSGGEIPYARLIHAKYMVVDGRKVWVGTSNWEDGYFTRSRNVSVFIDSAHLGERLDRFFADLWSRPYARPAALAVPVTAPTAQPGP
jgi:phosphatidylserine/phosphatidylglycerophosphate/cardiolipin synthase-like enzyme